MYLQFNGVYKPTYNPTSNSGAPVGCPVPRSPFPPDAVGLSTAVSSLPGRHWATALQLFEAAGAKARHRGIGVGAIDP